MGFTSKETDAEPKFHLKKFPSTCCFEYQTWRSLSENRKVFIYYFAFAFLTFSVFLYCFVRHIFSFYLTPLFVVVTCHLIVWVEFLVAKLPCVKTERKTVWIIDVLCVFFTSMDMFRARRRLEHLWQHHQLISI